MQLSSISLAITRQYGPLGGGAFSPLNLFSSGEQGAWYDPSDLTLGNMYQESTKATPVTAVEQRVGWIQDKSGRGNHAFQSTSISRPTLSARVNLLTQTEDFSAAAWTSVGVTITSYTGQKPDGTIGTIYRISVPSSTNSAKFAFQVTSLVQSTVASVGMVGAIYIKRVSGGSVIGLNVESNTTEPQNGGAYTAATHTVTDTWARYYVSGTWTGANQAGFAAFCIGNDGRLAAQANLPAIVVDIWGADLRVANDGIGLPAYQRVGNVSVTPSDYDTVGFPKYLLFDGIDDFLQTNSINFTSTDKMTVWAGVRKLSDAVGFPTLVEFGIRSIAGSFGISPTFNSNENKYGFALQGTAVASYIASTYVAPITNVVSASMNIGGTGIANELFPRINGVTPTLAVDGTNNNAGTGNFGNYPLYIGRRGGTTLPFNGRIYSLIVRGAQSTPDEISKAEAYVNNLTKAYA